MYKISILIPVYGVENYIKTCCESLFNNTIAKDCEFIFVNDCSVDNSMEILNLIKNKFSNLSIKIINHEKNQGLAAARNSALQFATGEYICCIDSDDWVELDCFETIYNAAKEDNSDIVVFGYFEEKEKNRVQKPQFFSNTKEGIYKDFLTDKLRGYIWNKMIKRQLFIDNNILWRNGINMWEDIYINSRLLLIAEKFTTINKCLYHYRFTNPYSIVHTKNAKKYNDVIFVLKEIELLLKKSNNFHIYEKEFYYKIVSFKMSVVRNLWLSKKQVFMFFSNNDFIFLKKNIQMYPSFQKKFFVFLFSRKMIGVCLLLIKIQLLIKDFNIYKKSNDIFNSIEIEKCPLVCGN